MVNYDSSPGQKPTSREQFPLNRHLAPKTLFQADLLVSLNNGRPKKKQILLESSYINIFATNHRVPPDSVIGIDGILFVTQRTTQRRTSAHNTALTVFYANKLIDSQVKTVEMIFHDEETRDLWQSQLSKLGEWFISPIAEIPVTDNSWW